MQIYNILKEYVETCRVAAETNDLAMLKKYLPKLKSQLMDAQYNIYISKYIETAIDNGFDEVYGAVIGEVTDFYSTAMKKNFEQLVKKDKENYLEQLFKAVEKKSSPKEAVKFRTVLLLNTAFHVGSVKMARRAVENGADIHLVNTNFIMFLKYEELNINN